MIQLPTGDWINPRHVLRLRTYQYEGVFKVSVEMDGHTCMFAAGETKEQADKQRDSLAQQIRDYIYPDKP